VKIITIKPKQIIIIAAVGLPLVHLDDGFEDVLL
jgi:hypothetical protein